MAAHVLMCFIPLSGIKLDLGQNEAPCMINVYYLPTTLRLVANYDRDGVCQYSKGSLLSQSPRRKFKVV